MMSRITEIKTSLEDRHYFRKVRPDNYWYDFTADKMNREYIQRFGDQFCIVLYSSLEVDDSYIIPFKFAKAVFTNEMIDRRNRWTGTIQNDILGVYHKPAKSKFLMVAEFYNAFHLFYDIEPVIDESDNFLLLEDSEDSGLINLREKIKEFNERYRNVTPYKKQVISEQVARPGPIERYLKSYHKHKCQLCNVLGFLKKDGTRYIETHHIFELHELIPGSYCSDNIIVVCPSCHKKLHYAKIVYRIVDQLDFKISINDQDFAVQRNILSAL